MSYTPGPWRYDFAPNSEEPGYMVMTDDIAVVAHVWPDNERGVSGGVVEANARLVAAAPEMLEALKGILACTTCSEREFDCTREWLAAEDAVAKAEGREP